MHRVKLVCAVGGYCNGGLLGLDATGTLGRRNNDFLQKRLTKILCLDGAAERNAGSSGDRHREPSDS
jgi:hypothetical protein